MAITDHSIFFIFISPKYGLNCFICTVIISAYCSILELASVKISFPHRYTLSYILITSGIESSKKVFALPQELATQNDPVMIRFALLSQVKQPEWSYVKIR
jgi:hypothetical protein